MIQSSVSGCSNAVLRVVSASGTDNVTEVTPSAMGVAIAIGTRGLTVTFNTTGTVSGTYIIEVTKGGSWAQLPEITVTTARALDSSGPTVVSGGTNVGYIAVDDPDDDDEWQVILDRCEGRDDIYNFVPLTHDVEVQNLFEAQVNAESSAEAGNWKGMFIALLGKTTEMVVGQSSADAQALTPTSTDGGVVLATLEDNPEASGIQYTLLSV